MTKVYTPKILKINLREETTEIFNVPQQRTRDFIGGSGLACRILFDMIDKDTEPLSASNPLLFMTGPLTGTSAPSSGRHVVCARSPLTNLWGESNSGGKWGTELKLAGYDGLLLTEQAKSWKYILIKDNKVEIKNGEHLRGLDTYEIQYRLREEENEKFLKVSTIGIAGENLVKFASVMNDEGRAAGRTGMGAVLGSKKIKAIAVKGSGKIGYYDLERFKKVSIQACKEVKEVVSSQMYNQVGTSGFVNFAQALGDMPNKYWSQGLFDTAVNISGSTITETILTGKYHCYACPIGCGREVKLKEDSRYRLREKEGPEYETVSFFGSQLLVDNLDGVCVANEFCNKYGLDTISCGGVISFAYYLFDKGIITVNDTDGLKLKWGDIDTAIKLIEKIAKRDGFGNVLAEGTKAVAKKYHSENLAVHVHGLDVPAHDPRAFTGMAVVYVTAPRGADHMSGDVYHADLGTEVPEFGITSFDRFQHTGKGILAANCENHRALWHSMIMCVFSNPPMTDILEMINASTGFNYTMEELVLAGERIFTLKRLFNLKLGYDVKDERLPEMLLKPIEGGTEGNVPDMEKLLNEYYEYRNWDRTTGKPSKEKIEKLGLQDIY